MRTIRYLFIFLAAVVCLAGSVEAQKRPVRRPAPRPTPTPRPTLPPLEVRTARQTVSNQQANVTRFVDVLASVGGPVENLDKELKAKPISNRNKAVFDRNETDKKKLVEAIRGLRAGLVSLENEFRSKPVLRVYLPQIQGIAALSAQSEDSAIAGRFVDARKPLITIAAKLSDTLAAMPGGSTAVAPGTRFRAGVSIGMTGPEVRASSWGAPIRINRISSTTEQWIYRGTRSLRLVNGKVTVISP